MKNNLSKTMLVVLVYLFSVLPVSADPAGPTDQLQPTLDKLLDILSDSALKGDEHKTARREKIMDTITISFDFREMSKRILSSKWKSINEDEKDHFTRLMTKLLENNYVGQLENYSGETVKYVGERIKGQRAQVSTLIENKKIKYPVHYIMMHEEDRWMVYDINIEGVSLVRNYRAEFKSILRKQKFAGLVKVLEEKNKSFD